MEFEHADSDVAVQDISHSVAGDNPFNWMIQKTLFFFFNLDLL